MLNTEAKLRMCDEERNADWELGKGGTGNQERRYHNLLNFLFAFAFSQLYCLLSYLVIWVGCWEVGGAHIKAQREVLHSSYILSLCIW